MGNPVKRIIDQIMDQVATISGDSNRSTTPYYEFGEKEYSTQVYYVPKVRWKESDTASVGPGEKRQSVDPSGSLGTFVQPVVCTIWAEDYDAWISEFQLIAKAIDKIKPPTQNSASINQLPVFNNLTVDWADTSARSLFGKKGEFTFPIRLNVPEIIHDYATILTASTDLSMSLPATTGSYAETVNYSFTTSSFE